MIAAVVRQNRLVERLRRDRRGLAMIEFSIALPTILTLSLAGAELTHYVTVRMRISQVALHLADNAARMGVGIPPSPKSVSETDINDVLTGARLQGGSLDIYGRGRVILSDLEVDPDRAGRFKIKWQRCRGSKTHASSFGKEGDNNLSGIGPAGRMVTTRDENATMFVEVYYQYKPLIGQSYAPSITMVETASMSVRDRRDLSQIYNLENAPKAACST